MNLCRVLIAKNISPVSLWGELRTFYDFLLALHCGFQMGHGEIMAGRTTSPLLELGSLTRLRRAGTLVWQ